MLLQGRMAEHTAFISLTRTHQFNPVTAAIQQAMHQMLQGERHY
ncbi:MAG: hypothetical protein R3E89_20205 [Thiolinea sp.]